MTMKISDKWRTGLEKTGYEHHVSDKRECEKLRRFSRVWRRVFKQIKLSPFLGNNSNIFEVGCGGGKHLMMFALNGWKCVGLDCSREVLERAKNYMREASDICKKNLDVNLICEDFLDYNPPGNLKFDVVFQVGVLEHFLDESERLAFLKKMFVLLKPGGYMISIVPSGVHPIRQKMKQLKLGGYDIPEIDYTPSLMKTELEKFDYQKIEVLPHNIFGYFLIDNRGGFLRTAMKIFYYLFQIIPVGILPYNFAARHASILISIAEKSL